MKQYESLDDALNNIEVKKTKVLPTVNPDDQPKKKTVFKKTPNSELKGKTFFFNNSKYVVKAVKEGFVVTDTGIEFRISDLRNNNVEFKNDKSFKPAMFIKASTNSSGEYDDNDTVDSDLEVEKNIAFETNEESEKDVKNGAQTNLARLNRDTKAIKNIYVKKVPDYKSVNSQIEILEKEKSNYLQIKNLLFADKCDVLINELKARKKEIDKAFSLKAFTDEDRKINEEKVKNLRSNPEYKEILDKRVDLKIELKENSQSAIITELTRFKKQIEIQNDLSNTDIIDLDDYLDDNVESSDLINNYNDFCFKIATILNNYVQETTAIHYELVKELESKSEEDLTEDDLEYLKDSNNVQGLDDIFTDYLFFDTETVMNLNVNQIRKMLKIALDDKYRAIKSDLEITENQLRFKKNEILQGEISLSNYLVDMFDFSSDDAYVEQSKEVLAAVNAEYVTRIAYSEAMSLGVLHNLDEAISGGMLGLARAIQAWMTVQKSLPTTPTDFQHLLYLYVKSDVRKSLQGLVSTQISGGALSTASHHNRKMLEAAIRNNPQLKLMDPKMVEELVMGSVGETSYNKIAKEVSETELAGMIGGDEDGSVDVWSKIGGQEDIDMVEAQNYYRRVINSISSLMDEFEVAEDKMGETYVKTNKMFDSYDRIILMMKFGFTFDYMGKEEGNDKYLREDKTNEAGIKMEATNDEIKDACTRYAQEVLNDYDKTFTTNAISSRYNKMMKVKLPLLMKHKPEIEEGLKYMLLWAKTNGEALKRMSSFREEKTLIKTREQLLELYSDQLEEVGHTKLIDGRSLIDTYQASQQNNIGDDIGTMFNDLMI